LSEGARRFRAAALLLDIEGTLGSKAFVSQVLYPYSHRHLRAYLARHAQEPVVQQALRDTLALAGQPAADPAGLLLAWIAQDRKAPPLKTLQGLIWQDGYESGAFAGHLYPDALAALQRWHQRGIPLAIYSSGSVRAQRLYFEHSVAGNLLPWFDRHFDTAIGAKTEVDSYLRIAQAWGQAPERILFLSDNPAELQAAQGAGLQWLHVRREDTDVAPGFAAVTDFSAIELEHQA